MGEDQTIETVGPSRYNVPMTQTHSLPTLSTWAHQVVPGDRLANTSLPVTLVTEGHDGCRPFVVFHFGHGLSPITRGMFDKVEVHPASL